MQNLTPEILASIRAVVDYNWEDEREDARERYAENGDIDDHIFCDIVRLNNLVHGIDTTPESYLQGTA